MLSWALLSAGCVWVPSSDLDARWAELIDADGDGHDDVAYGGDDCDDSDPTAYPGAVEKLGDELDSDCDGEPDGSVWTLVDLRGSQGVQGPRLALGEEDILLAWQAETIQGDTTLHDGFGLLRLDVEVPTGPELGVWLEGEAGDAGTSGPFDMDAVGGGVFLGLSSRDETERFIAVHGLPDDLSTHHAVSTEPFDGEPFQTLQVGTSEADATIVVGCGQDGAGVHGVALWGDELVAGEAELTIDTTITGDGQDQGVCEVDPLYMAAYANNHPLDDDYLIYGYNQDEGHFAYQDTQPGVFAWVDHEITDEHGFTLQMLIDKTTDRVLVMTIAPLLEGSFLETWTRLPSLPVDGDIAPSATGESYACVVYEGGEVTLYWSDLWEQGAFSPIESYTPAQDELGQVAECALVVTAQDLVVLAARSDEGIWLNRYYRAATEE